MDERPQEFNHVDFALDHLLILSCNGLIGEKNSRWVLVTRVILAHGVYVRSLTKGLEPSIYQAVRAIEAEDSLRTGLAGCPQSVILTSDGSGTRLRNQGEFLPPSLELSGGAAGRMPSNKAPLDRRLSESLRCGLTGRCAAQRELASGGVRVGPAGRARPGGRGGQAIIDLSGTRSVDSGC